LASCSSQWHSLLTRKDYIQHTFQNTNYGRKNFWHPQDGMANFVRATMQWSLFSLTFTHSLLYKWGNISYLDMEMTHIGNAKHEKL